MKLIQMKWLVIVGVVAGVAAVAGFLSYPSMRYQLTGLASKVPPPASTAPQAAPPAPAPQDGVIPPAATPTVIDLSQLTPSQLPAQVTLNIATEVADASGLKLKVDAGSRLKLVRLEGDQVVVSPGTSPFEGRVPISGTDLMEQLATNPPAPAVTDPSAAIEPAPFPAQPAPPADTLPAATPPATAAEPGTPPAAAPATPGDVVEVMKAHIRGGGIKEFTFEQVQDWQAGADEVSDGSTYQTGLIHYKAETVFGEKILEAKALTQDGKVVRWVWTKSNTEIK